MIIVENIEVFGWKAALRGMRNAMNSWNKADTTYFEDGGIEIGENDMKLCKSLVKAGSDHGKFLRMIHMQCDITGPLYWWKEFDTYKVGTVANSCSTMHKIHAEEFTDDDFSHEHLNQTGSVCLDMVKNLLNSARNKYNETGDKKYWWQMIQLLPSSYNQKRTVDLNYEVLKHIYHAREGHRLDEWDTFRCWCDTLPYFKELCVEPLEKHTCTCGGNCHCNEK